MSEVDVVSVRQIYRIKDILKSKYGVKFTGNKCACPFPDHEDKSPSFSVFVERATGLDYFKCQGCGRKGDVLELVAKLERVSMREAAKVLNGGTVPEVGLNSPPLPAVPPPPPARFYDKRIPDDAIMPLAGRPFDFAFSASGKPMKAFTPQLVHVYRDADGIPFCVVVRKRTPDGGKACIPMRYSDGQWYIAGYSDIDQERPPVYGLDDAAAYPDKPVLIVEGEKNADDARAAFPEFVVLTWQGGTQRVDRADWVVLKGRNVIVWPDNDEPGEKVLPVIKKAGAARVRWLVLPEERPKGWDVSDELKKVLDAGGTPKDVLRWLKSNLQEDVTATPVPARSRPVLVHVSDWLPEDKTLVYTANGSLKQSSPINSNLTLRHHPAFAGRFAYDVFDHEVLVDGKPISGPAVMQIAQELYQMNRIEPPFDVLQRQISDLAQENRINRLVEHLLGLPWDGKHRLMPNEGTSQGLLPNYANVVSNPYTQMAGARWLFGLVRRLIEEQWRHDNVLVFEGDQGARKTTFFQTLARIGQWDLYTDLAGGGIGRNDKDDLLKLRGKAIVELAEMTAHRKADVDSFKSFMDRQVDYYRPPYASQTEAFPRRCVFAGTTNKTSSYLTDTTGNRRFWPVLVRGIIEVERFAQDVEQIWAEAIHFGVQKDDKGRYVHANYLTDQELAIQANEVDGRQSIDPWREPLENWIRIMADPDVIDKDDLWEPLSLPIRDRTARESQRISEIMEQIGYRYGQGPGGRGGRKWRKRKG